MKRVLIINGPNINMLGQRDKDIYGEDDYDSLKTFCSKEAKKLDIEIDIRQSNSESEIVEWIQRCRGFDAVIINPAAYTHTSIAIADALEILDIPVVEVHISNILAREDFRRESMTAKYVDGVICGFGIDVYKLGLIYIS